MKKIFLILVFLLINNSFGQYNRSREKIESIELGLDQELEIIIDLPASYTINTKRLYPWIISLDGEHFVDILTSTIKYGNYWDIYPECIIIGINHKGNRNKYYSQDNKTGELTEFGQKFYNFFKNNLLYSISKTYRINTYNIIVGYDNSAGFLNHILINDPNLFNSYIAISPEIHENNIEKIILTLQNNSNNQLNYLLASSQADDENILNNVTSLNQSLTNSKNFKFYSHIYEDLSHYAIIPVALTQCLNNLFALFKPIDKFEYDKNILGKESHQTTYLIEKYDLIYKNFGFKKIIPDTDLLIIEEDIRRKNNLNELLILSEFCKKEFPKTILSNYFEGLYYELNNEITKALKIYKSAYSKSDYGVYKKEIISEKLEKLSN